MQFDNFFFKFLELDQDFFIKIEVVNKNDFLCWSNWHNSNVKFDKKFLLFKKFNENDQIASILKKSKPN